MPSERHDPSRRSVLQLTGLSLSGLAGITGVAAADGSPSGSRGRSGKDRQLWVEGGKFQLDLDSEVSAPKQAMWEAAIEDFNQSIEAGHMSIEAGNERKSKGATAQAGASGQGDGVLELHSSPSEMVDGNSTEGK